MIGTKSVEEILAKFVSPLDGYEPPPVTGKCQCGQELYGEKTRCHHCEYLIELRARQREAIVTRALESIPKRYHWATAFDVPDLAKRVKVPVAIAKAKASIGEERVVLLGPAGIGKTVLATVLALTYAKAGRQTAFADALELAAARAQHGLGEGEAELVETAIEVDVLVLDDLGAERATPNAAIADIIHARHGEQRTTIITSGFSPQAIGERYGSGIARRVFEDAFVIDMFAKGAR